MLNMFFYTSNTGTTFPIKNLLYIPGYKNSNLPKHPKPYPARLTGESQTEKLQLRVRTVALLIVFAFGTMMQLHVGSSRHLRRWMVNLPQKKLTTVNSPFAKSNAKLTSTATCKYKHVNIMIDYIYAYILWT